MHNISELLRDCDFIQLTDHQSLENTFSSVYATDLISMVIKHGKDEPILITQIDADATLGVAIMLNLPAIILTENKTFRPALIKKANDSHIAVIKTPLTAVDAIVKLVRMGIL